MNENAASRASAMRCPGGRTAAGAGADEGEVEFAGQCEHAAAIDMRLDEIGDRLEPRLERLRFARLHEAEMALGQRDLSLRGRAPTTGTPIASIASTTSRRWRSLPTRLTMTPATSSRGS